MNLRLLLSVLSVTLLPLLAGAQMGQMDLVIRNARVIDVRTGDIRTGQSIWIKGDTIVAIGRPNSGPRVRAARTVDAGGGYVIPGLWDMHVHFGGGAALIAENRNLLPLYTAHGIVAVRDAAGDLSESVLAWRDSIARGLLDGPTIFTSGPKLEGVNSVWPGDIEVDTRAGVDSALDRLQAMRVDFVKLTDNTLKPELFRYALGELRKRGLKSSAHIPQAVLVREAIAAGLGSIEHLSYAIRAGTEVAGQPPVADVIAAFDSSLAMAAYRLMAERGTASPQAIARRHAIYEFSSTKLHMLQAAGITILAGTDAGFLNSFVYPGIGLHDELQLMVKAGLTPLQALQAATINGARFLEREARHGVVEVGHAADLVILVANPLADITATRKIRSVILRGRHHGRSELDALLRAVAKRADDIGGTI